jgi:acetate---CoA ligase (ADP-forming)
MHMFGERQRLEPAQQAGTIAAKDEARALLTPGPMNEANSKRLFAHFGMPVTREVVAKTPVEAQSAAKAFSGTVVVKVLSRKVLHKSEVGGVALDIAPDAVAQTCTEIAKRFTALTQLEPEGFLIQEFVTGGVELILGFHHDAQLGPIVLLGAGGISAELFRDTALRLAPLSRLDAQAMIEELKSAPLLKGFRGRPPADVAALIDAIVAFSTMIEAIGDDLEEAEINPLLVLPQGRGVVAADALVVVREKAT